MTDEIENVIKENGRVITGRQKGIYAGAAVMLSGNKVMALDRSNMDFSNMYMLEVMTKQGFEEYMLSLIHIYRSKRTKEQLRTGSTTGIGRF